MKFYLGQNEGCSLGASTSESSKGLLQRERGTVRIHVILVKGIHARAHVFSRKVSTGLVKPCASRGTGLTMGDFSAFPDRGRYKNWARKIGSGKYLCEALSWQFPPPQQRAHISTLHPERLQGVLKVSRFSRA